LSGFGSLARLIDHPPVTHLLNPTAPESELLNQLRLHRDQAAHELAGCNALVLPLLFRFFRIWLLLPLVLLVPFAFVPELRRFDFANVPTNVWLIIGGCLAGIIVLYVLAKKLVTPRAKAAATALASAHQLAEVCGQKSEASFKAETQRIQSAFNTTTQALNNNWKQVRANARGLRNDWTDRLNDQARQLGLQNDERRRVKLNRIAERHAEQTAQLHEQTSTRTQTLESSYAENLNRITATRDEGFRAIEAEWQNVVLPTLATLQQANAEAKKLFPPWDSERWNSFRMPDDFLHAAPFGSLAVDLEKFCEVSLAEANSRCPTSASSPCRCKFPFPQQASVLFETKTSGHEQVIGALNNLVLRLLTSAPPGRLAFTIFDPVGLGQNFRRHHASRGF
jgi:S-DNA-T family DNA segregation ATPase FtsK/SpoIIIE